MLDREEIEALCEGTGGLGRQEVEDLLELHDAYVRLRDKRDAPLPAAGAAKGARAVASRNARGRLCYLGREMPGGPWHREPDLVEFRHADLNCVLERSPNGTWCGYVEVPLDHAWRIIDDLTTKGASGVHGAISCIRPRGGLASGVDFIGFECDHTELGDLIPSHRSLPGKYRDLTFARAEVERMARLARYATVAREARRSSASATSRGRGAAVGRTLRDTLRVKSSLALIESDIVIMRAGEDYQVRLGMTRAHMRYVEKISLAHPTGIPMTEWFEFEGFSVEAAIADDWEVVDQEDSA